MGCRGGLANGKEEDLAERLGEVVSVAWLGWCEGGRTGKSVRDRDWNDVKRLCMEGGTVEMGSWDMGQ